MADLRTEPHEITKACEADHCLWHNVDEPAEGAHRVCYECGHAFLTAADLLAAHNAAMADLAKASETWGPRFEHVPETDVERVYSCAFCSHDW